MPTVNAVMLPGETRWRRLIVPGTGGTPEQPVDPGVTTDFDANDFDSTDFA